MSGFLTAAVSAGAMAAGAFALVAIGYAAGRRSPRRRASGEPWSFGEQPSGAVSESADVGFFQWHAGGVILEADDAFLRIAGRTRQDLLEGLLDWRAITGSETPDALTPSIAGARSLMLLRPDGAVVPVVAAMTTFDEQLQRGIGFLLDDSARASAVEALQSAHDVLRQRVAALTHETVTDQPAASDVPHLGESVEDLAARLAAANAELEAFAYSVSHDLRAPLRTIDGFSRELIESHSAALEPQAKHYLARIRAATQKMGGLIDAILELSRVSRADLRIQRVDLSSIAARVADDLRARGSAVSFRVEEGVNTAGDPILLQVVFENLMGNAAKFSARTPDAVVEFGRDRTDDGDVFYVRDNGAGFDPLYATKLFSPFQRLHPVAQFEGTGIGLAIVQRIIGRHGGRVWATSSPGEGATFCFTISPGKDESWTRSSS